MPLVLVVDLALEAELLVLVELVLEAVPVLGAALVPVVLVLVELGLEAVLEAVLVVLVISVEPVPHLLAWLELFVVPSPHLAPDIANPLDHSPCPPPVQLLSPTGYR